MPLLGDPDSPAFGTQVDAWLLRTLALLPMAADRLDLEIVVQQGPGTAPPPSGWRLPAPMGYLQLQECRATPPGASDSRIRRHRVAAPPSSTSARPCGPSFRRAEPQRSRAWPRYGDGRSWRSCSPVPITPANAAGVVISSVSTEYGSYERAADEIQTVRSAMSASRQLVDAGTFGAAPVRVAGTPIHRADWLAPRAGLSSGPLRRLRLPGAVVPGSQRTSCGTSKQFWRD